MTYQAPLKDMLFVMEHLAGLDGIAALPGFEDHGRETAEAVLEESAKFCEGVVAPLNVAGDKNPSAWKDGEVSTTPGFKQAFEQFAAGGWQGVVHPVEHGGQGLPKLIATGCMEMLHAANLSFALCPMLTDGAIEALLTAGSDTLKQLYLEKMISGQWTGTMNLTEPQAGSDLAAVRTRAERQDDGSYKLFGTKIFITYGEHDMAENIVHLVLARVPGAPEAEADALRLVQDPQRLRAVLGHQHEVPVQGALPGQRDGQPLPGSLDVPPGWLPVGAAAGSHGSWMRRVQSLAPPLRL